MVSLCFQVRRIIQTCVIIYVGVFALWLKQGYQEFSEVESSVTTKVKGITMSRLNPNSSERTGQCDLFSISSSFIIIMGIGRYQQLGNVLVWLISLKLDASKLKLAVVAAIAMWFCLSLPSCGPRFKSQVHHLCFFQFVLKL